MSDGLEFVDMGTDDPNVFGCRVPGKLTGDDINTFAERVEAIRAGGSKARIYIDITAYDDFEMSVVKEKFAAMSTFWNGIGKLAYVVDKSWMANMVGLIDAVTPMHLRAFSSEQDAEARAWVIAED